jgi:hypothetical protein
VEWISERGVGGNTQWVRTLVSASSEGADRAAMLEVAPISPSINEKSDGTINPSSSTVNMTGSKMKTISHEYHFSENGQNGRTP